MVKSATLGRKHWLGSFIMRYVKGFLKVIWHKQEQLEKIVKKNKGGETGPMNLQQRSAGARWTARDRRDERNTTQRGEADFNRCCWVPGQPSGES